MEFPSVRYGTASALTNPHGLIAEAFEMDREDLKRRRAQSVRNVKATNGLISLEKYARFRQEQDWNDDEWQD